MRRFRQPPQIEDLAYGHHSTPYERLAVAVILEAVTDFTRSLEEHRNSAWDFFFSDSPAHVWQRTHWFNQAGLVLPDKAVSAHALASHQRHTKFNHNPDTLFHLTAEPKSPLITPVAARGIEAHGDDQQ